jgi:hypothetical protein
MVVIDQTRLGQAFAQAQLAFDDCDRARTQEDAAIFSRLFGIGKSRDPTLQSSARHLLVHWFVSGCD